MEFTDFCEFIPDKKKPFLDRHKVREFSLTDDQWQWRRDGHIIKREFIPHDLIDNYCRRWLEDNDLKTGRGYQTPTPYLFVDEIKDLCLHPPLMAILKEIIGYSMGMHLNLTDWISTERNWHQDDYLNPDFIRGHYAAVWFALDDIPPISGLFEYIPGSHRWPVVRRSKVTEHLKKQNFALDESWPKQSENFLNELFERQIRETGGKVQRFQAQKGDVLIWHPWLTHRGSKPLRSDLRRKSIISHYSSIRHRTDMPSRSFHTNGEIYFVL